MKDETILDENWSTLLSLFPKNWQALAQEHNALSRSFKNFPSVESLMRTLLIHLAQGYSLRETVVRAQQANIACVSDVALLKRLKCSERWFQALCQCLLNEMTPSAPSSPPIIQMRIVDGTHIKEPGKTGSVWRVHYSIQFPQLYCDYLKMTSTKGEATGESILQFPVAVGDCIMGDRAYATANGIYYLAQKQAYSLVRFNGNSLVLFKDKEKTAFNLLSELKKIAEPGTIREWEVMMETPTNSLLVGRLCVIRRSENAIQLALKKLKERARRKKNKVRPATIEFAKYIMVFTTLPSDLFTTQEILSWYRFRWQIELVFKRLKSLAGLGHLPKRHDASARAWLYGKLFLVLLSEKLIRHGKNFAPGRY